MSVMAKASLTYLLMGSCHKTNHLTMIHLSVKLAVAYRQQHSTGVKKPDVRWREIYKDTTEKAGGKKVHAHPVVSEDPLFILVQVWVYVFTSSDVCYLSFIPFPIHRLIFHRSNSVSSGFFFTFLAFIYNPVWVGFQSLQTVNEGPSWCYRV